MENMHLHPPSLLKRLAEKMGYEITPADICSGRDLDGLYRTFPDLAGDKNIGPGDDGKCQSWRDNPGWWGELTAKRK